jgi:hypothetical protein
VANQVDSTSSPSDLMTNRSIIDPPTNDMPEAPSDTAELARKLRTLGKRIPTEQVRSVRELAQKEYDTDLKSQDTILSRANTLLASSGVAVGLLLNLSKDGYINSISEWSLLSLTLIIAVLAVGFALYTLKASKTKTFMQSESILGEAISESKDPKLWQRDHEISLAVKYLIIRDELSNRNHHRAKNIFIAQILYLLFILMASSLGLTILMQGKP